MEYFNRVLCVNYQDMQPIVSYNALRQLAVRGRIKNMRPGKGEGNYALFSYDSIPVRYKEEYEKKFGNPYKNMELQKKKDSMKMDPEAREFYEAYIYEKNGEETRLSTKLIDEYTLNASVLRTLIHSYNERMGLKKALGGKCDVMKGIARDSEDLRDIYAHTLPSNERILKKKMDAFKKGSYASVLSRKIGNNNTLKMTDDASRMLIAMKRSRTPVYTDMQLLESYNEKAEAKGWKLLKSVSSMKTWLNSAQVSPLWWDAVYGEQVARQHFGRKHRTELPKLKDALWYGDGTKLNFYYQDEHGEERTVQVYEVIDASSEMLLGYYISDREDYEAQYNAYRMAIQLSGHKPYEIVHDNQGGHKKLESGGFMNKICEINRSTMPYNGESKTIESIFGRFQAQVLHKHWSFTGQNVTTKKLGSRPNVEFVDANKGSLFTLKELKEAYAEARAEWNDMKCPYSDKSRKETYMTSENPETQRITEFDMIDMFWIESKKPMTFTDSGIMMTINGKKHQYEVCSEPGIPDHEWRSRHTWEKFSVKYDPNDLTSIRLYSIDKDGSKRFERIATPYIVVHRAILEQTDFDRKFIRQEQNANFVDRLERLGKGKDIEYEYGTAPEQHGLRTPIPKGISKEEKKQIEQRIARYKVGVDETQLGRRTKLISNEDWNDYLGGNETKNDERKSAAKL